MLVHYFILNMNELKSIINHLNKNKKIILIYMEVIDITFHVLFHR